MKQLYHFRTPGRRRAARGMVLIVTLLIMVAMLLVSTALLRSSDTAVQVVSNLSFHQAAEASANMAVEQAIQTIQSGGALPGNFYGSRQAGESREGIPAILLAGPGPRAGVGFIQVSDMSVTYIVERMCANAAAGLTPANCMGTGSAGGIQVIADGIYREPGVGFFSPVSRISIRVDGLRNTTVFAQAFIN